MEGSRAGEQHTEGSIPTQCIRPDTTMSTTAPCLVNTALLIVLLIVVVTKSDLDLTLGTSGQRASSLLRTDPLGDDDDTTSSIILVGSGDKDAPIEQLENSDTTKYHIFVASKPDTGSTLLANMVLGLFDTADSNQSFMHHNFDIVSPKGASIDDCILTKTHITDLDVLYTHFRDDYDHIFFIAPNRGHTKVEDRYCGVEYQHMVLCLEFDEFVFKDESQKDEIISYVAKRIREKFPYFSKVELDEGKSSKRLTQMAEAMEYLKDKSFSIADQKYGVHGGHSGRGDGA